METRDTTSDTTTRTNPTGTMAHREGPVAKTIEEQTSKVPSDAFLWVAVGIMATSALLQLTRKQHWSLFIGEWAAPLLLMGLYNKLVKVQGHDQYDHA